MGLLDYLNTPSGMGLLSAAAGYAANARRGTPVNNIGRGLAAGMIGYSQANEQQKALEKEQAQREALARIFNPVPTQQTAYKANGKTFASPQKATEYVQAFDPAQELGSALAGEFGAKKLPENTDFSQYATDPFVSPNMAPKMNIEAVTQESAKPMSRQQQIQSAVMVGLVKPEDAFKLMAEGDTNKPQLVDIYDQASGQMVKKWVIPGQADGVQVGFGKPEEVKPNPREDVHLENGQWQTMEFNPKTRQFDLPIGTPFSKRPTAGESKLSVGNISLGTEKKYGEQFAGKVADSDMAALDAARNAPQLAERANRVKQVLETGKVITGFGADVRLQLGKALGLVGASDKETIANTEALSADLARNTLDAIKASGLGSGNGFSNADRDFLNKAAGGLITFEAGTLKRLADLSYRAAQQSANKWNTRAKQIPRTALEGTGIPSDNIEIPPLYQPQAQEFNMLPNAKQYEGKTMRDTKSGKRYRSINGKWQEVK